MEEELTRPLMSLTSIIAIIAGLAALILAGWGVAVLWSSLGVTMTMHGWIAYGLGAVGCLGLSIGLFWLLFHSARGGHDDLVGHDDLDG
ncbi:MULTISPECIES: hypothetical protein [Henriciella]|uniref:Uncharacterized protein n=1 Tax=Henriciella pelagia TaxID=1977912 RepID=A0ABQ1JJT6_9PROT|nr:hypothetical protein [Henriciella pelagia]GGB70788.1 hypothetical protein GCM10011503_19350 [Henriciella pelagia]